jgi:hypothetical protein
MLTRISIRWLRRFSRALTISEPLLVVAVCAWALLVSCAGYAVPLDWWAS